jgi:hypothetical protein
MSTWFALAGVWLAFAVALATVVVGEPSWWPYLALLGVGVTCLFAAHLARISLRSFAKTLLPRSWPGGALGAVIGVSLVVAVARLPSIVTSGYSGLTGPSSSLEEADVQPLSVSAPSEAIAAAARTIPRGATYSVVGGDKYDVWAVFRFWLAPRVFTPDYLHAPWVVVVDDPSPKGLPPGRKIALAPGVYALEVTP